jgi:hypothetical protein
MISLIFLLLAIGCYTVSQLQQHGKLRWMQHGNYRRTFWDEDSYLRKYKLTENSTVIKAPDNWYYRFFKIKYKERFPLSATLLVPFTDGYHLMQFFFSIFLSLSVSIPLDTRLSEGWEFGIVWAVVHLVHFLIYKLLQR